MASIIAAVNVILRNNKARRKERAENEDRVLQETDNQVVSNVYFDTRTGMLVKSDSARNVGSVRNTGSQHRIGLSERDLAELHPDIVIRKSERKKQKSSRSING